MTDKTVKAVKGRKVRKCRMLIIKPRLFLVLFYNKPRIIVYIFVLSLAKMVVRCREKRTFSGNIRHRHRQKYPKGRQSPLNFDKFKSSD